MSKKEYAMKLYDFDLKWKIENEQVLVTALLSLSARKDNK
jgi:hypothetical protein